MSRSLFFSRVYLGKFGFERDLEIISSRPHKEFLILKFQGIQTIDQTLEFIGSEVFVPEENLDPLGEDEFYQYQVIGCSVSTQEGKEIGIVSDILVVKGNDLLVIQGNQEELLIPFSEGICVEVDLENGKIVIDPPDGLLELDEI
ncbi:ribosome maturation factor RimM [Acidobacteriota bacterium]